MRRETPSSTSRVGVVVPIRSFTDAKARLAEVLDPVSRADLARRMAERVLDAAGPLHVIVVSSAPEVRAWATARGVAVIDDPGGLDEAAAAGRDACREASCSRVVVAHADLPRAQSLLPLASDLDQPVVALVPCHRDDGTNVLSIPVDAPFRFAYGPGSFRRHVVEARRLGLGVRVVRLPDLAFDIDEPEDLAQADVPCTRP